jgi:hypothetical protein
MSTTSDSEAPPILAPARLERTCARCTRHTIAFVARHIGEPTDTAERLFAIAPCPHCGLRANGHPVRALVAGSTVGGLSVGVGAFLHLWLVPAVAALPLLYGWRAPRRWIAEVRESRRRVKFVTASDANGPFRGDTLVGTRPCAADESNALTVVPPARLERTCVSCKRHSVGFVERRGVGADDTAAVFAIAPCPHCRARPNRGPLRSVAFDVAIAAAVLGAGAALHFNLTIVPLLVASGLFRTLLKWRRALTDSRERVEFLNGDEPTELPAIRPSAPLLTGATEHA